MSFEMLDDFRKRHQETHDANSKAMKKKRKVVEQPVVEALVPKTAADIARDSVDTLSSVIEGDGSSSDRMVIGMAQSKVIDHLKQNPSVMIEEEKLLQAAGVLAYKTREIQALREVLRKHPQLEFLGQLVAFRPTYNISNKDQLEELLKQRYLAGTGSLHMEKLNDSYPSVQRDVETLVEEKKAYVIIPKTRSARFVSKEHTYEDSAIVIYRDTTFEIDVDAEFIQKWRDCKLDSKASADIRKDLEKAKLPLMSTEVKHDQNSKRRRRKKPARTHHTVAKLTIGRDA
eukprot:m.209760 g.209760  ORF g.209760 m.209760 type:complete len:287 (-) comp18997_c0_seq5:131-991(-)